MLVKVINPFNYKQDILSVNTKIELEEKEALNLIKRGLVEIVSIDFISTEEIKVSEKVVEKQVAKKVRGKKWTFKINI